MKIMATSDLHGNLEGLDPKGADVVVLAGDIASLHGQGADAIVKIYGHTFVDCFTRALQLQREAEKRDKSRKEK